MKIRGIVIVTAMSALLVGCAPPYRKEFQDTANREHWDKKQELLAFAYADKIFWSKDMKNGQYIFIYSRVPVGKVAAEMEQVLKDLDEIQSPKQAEWRKYGEVYNLANDFKHEEEVEKTIYTRVHAADLENQFKASMGESYQYGPEAEALKGYNIKRIFVNKPLAEAFPFKSDQIEGARKDGTLKEIQHATLDLTSKLDHKDVDPEHPDDKNAFVWKPKTLAIRLTNYKIINTEKPEDDRGNYIEGVRIIDGKEESAPCLKIFFPPSGGSAVVLVTTAREGEPGFGVPDILDNMSNIEDVQDVIKDGNILDALFAEKKEDERKVPPAKVFKIEISRLDNPIDPWQHDEKGYAVPFKYRLGLGDNYNVRIKFAKPDVDVNDTDAMVAAHEGFLDIEWVAKEYTQVGQRYNAGPGQVIEYYRPRKEFANHVKAQVLFNEDTKKLSFQLPDGTAFEGFVTPGANKFIEDKPFAVAYSEGEKRWWIEREEGSDLYTKRKQVSPPRESTGSYGGDVVYYDRASAMRGGPSEGSKPTGCVDAGSVLIDDTHHHVTVCPKQQ